MAKNSSYFKRAKSKYYNWIFWLGILLFVFPGLVHAYLLMPFPGSQNLEAITLCYYLEKIIFPLRIVGMVLILWYLLKYYAANTKRGKITKGVVLAVCLLSFYFTDVAYKAETMFKEPSTIKFSNGLSNKVPQSYVVIGVVNNGVAKAYPVIYLGYHHKVQDNVGDLPVLVTYCTMCRTARVFSPVINGKRQDFRLVGARHYNAIIEDQDTKTWWYQATGEAAVGKLKGTKLKELNYEQSTLSAWLKRYPASQILQPDGKFNDDYKDLKEYDVKQAVDKDSTLKNKDSLVRKSWVIGVINNGQAKGYEWRQMVKKRLLNDKIAGKPIVLNIEKDKQTFNVFDSSVDGNMLSFNLKAPDQMTDTQTNSTWNLDGLCVDGTLKGKQLARMQAYQEYWHSWKNFHSNTLFWK